MSVDNRARSLGFGAGVASVVRAFGFLLRRPIVWPLALVPAVLLLVLSAAFAGASVHWVGPAVRDAWGNPASVWARLGARATAWVAVAITALLGVALAFVLTPPLSSPALEKIVRIRERELGAPERAPLSLWTEMACGLRAQAVALSVSVPVLVILWLVDVVFPPAVVVTLPARYFVGALALAWNLLDYPLTLRGLGMRDRFAMVRRHFPACFGFGLGFVAVFSLPCFSVLMLPVGVAAAAELHTRMADLAA